MTPLNSLQRVLHTLGGRPVDRRPVLPVLSLYGAQLTGCPPERYFTDSAAYAAGQEAVRDSFAPDVLFGPFGYAVLGEAFGGTLRHFPDQAPLLRHTAIEGLADWERLRVPDPAVHPRLVYLRDSVRRLVQAHGTEVPVAVALPPLIDLPILAMGLEGWLDAVLTDPDAAGRALERLEPFWTTLANGLLEAGAAFLVLTSSFTSPAVVTPGIVQHFGKPWLERSLRPLRGPAVLHHIGAPMLAHLHFMLGLPSVAGYALFATDDLGKARTVVGPEPVLLGGPHGPSFRELTPGAVRSACASLLENRRDDPRFLLTTSGADIPFGTPAACIHAMREAAEAEAEAALAAAGAAAPRRDA